VERRRQELLRALEATPDETRELGRLAGVLQRAAYAYADAVIDASHGTMVGDVAPADFRKWVLTETDSPAAGGASPTSLQLVQRYAMEEMRSQLLDPADPALTRLTAKCVRTGLERLSQRGTGLGVQRVWQTREAQHTPGQNVETIAFQRLPASQAPVLPWTAREGSSSLSKGRAARA
jgi:hypothetical protein